MFRLLFYSLLSHQIYSTLTLRNTTPADVYSRPIFPDFLDPETFHPGSENPESNDSKPYYTPGSKYNAKSHYPSSNQPTSDPETFHFGTRYPETNAPESNQADSYYLESHYPGSKQPTSRYPQTFRTGPRYPESNYPGSKYGDSYYPESHYSGSNQPTSRYPQTFHPGPRYPEHNNADTYHPKFHYPGSYPESHYPQYADSYYPESHFRGVNCPASCFHHTDYPGSHYPKSRFPDSYYLKPPYPDSYYPESRYPDSYYPGTRYPDSYRPDRSSDSHNPGSRYPDANNPGFHYPVSHNPASSEGPNRPKPVKPNESPYWKIWNKYDSVPNLGSWYTSKPDPATKATPVPRLGQYFAPSLQWHVGIYSKSFTPYMQVCGGSLVKPDVVISAAHCFWNDIVGQLRAGLFAVGAGKLLRPFETEEELFAQHTDVKAIKIPPRFRGVKTSFQDDIAVVFLSNALEYVPGVMPICISFNLELERRHLTSGNLGTVAGWGLTEPNGPPAQRLSFVKLPYVDIEECLRTAEDSFLKYITSDKICAGDKKSGRALCRGDSGGGLVFYSSGIPYLHGIASTAPRDNNACNARAVATFTHVLAQRAFLVAHVPDIAEGCEELYGEKGVKNETTEVTREEAVPSTPVTPLLARVTSQKLTFVNRLANVLTEEHTSTELNQNDSAELIPTTEREHVVTPGEETTDVEVTPSVLTKRIKIKTKMNPALTEQIVTPSKKMADTEVKPTEDIQEVIEEVTSSYVEDDRATPTEMSEVEVTPTDETIAVVTLRENMKEVGVTRSEATNEVVVNVWSGVKGIARVPVDNGTKMFVCNCYCNK